VPARRANCFLAGFSPAPRYSGTAGASARGKAVRGVFY
jgi:hypothetical protein